MRRRYLIFVLTRRRARRRINTNGGDKFSTATHPHGNFPKYDVQDLTQFRTVVGLSCHKAMIMAENSLRFCIMRSSDLCLGPIIGYPSFVEADVGLWEKLVDQNVSTNSFHVMESWYGTDYHASGAAGFDKKAFRYYQSNEPYKHGSNLNQEDDVDPKSPKLLARRPASEEGYDDDKGGKG